MEEVSELSVCVNVCVQHVMISSNDTDFKLCFRMDARGASHQFTFVECG